jgi:hypothetical protein
MRTELITTEEAAHIAGIPPGTLRQRRRREPDHPAVVRFAGVILYDRQAFVKYAQAWTDARGTS